MFLNEPKLILLHTVKWLNALLCITNNSIKDQSFIYTQFKCQMILFDPEIGPYQELPFRIRVDVEAWVMKEYIAFPRAQGLEPHHHIV